jgi:hypothetical protein
LGTYLLSDLNQGDIPIIRAFLKICIITSAMLAALFALAVPVMAEQFAAIEIDAKLNSVDGCIDCGCRTKGQVEPGRKKQWWVAFGQVEPDGQEGWEAVASSSHCGAGMFRNVSSGFKRTIGIPYALLEFSTAIVSLPEGEVHLETDLNFSKLSGFDTKGEPVYANSIQKRTLSLDDNANLTLPILISSKREKEAFGVHEVLIRLNVSMNVGARTRRILRHDICVSGCAWCESFPRWRFRWPDHRRKPFAPEKCPDRNERNSCKGFLRS